MPPTKSASEMRKAITFMPTAYRSDSLLFVTLHVVIAPDSFKGTATAAEAAAAIAAGWLSVRSSDVVRLLPQADGGEGTVDVIAAVQPQARRHRVEGLTGPDGRKVSADWLELPDGTAVVDLASVCGLPLMIAPDALGASTRGLGELIRAAVTAGANSLVVGLGGSASTDGGAGALMALGLTLSDAHGAPLKDGGNALSALAHLDRSDLIPPPLGGVTLLSDVTAPLLGPRGAAAVFGPQKGASLTDVGALDSALTVFAKFLGGDPTIAGSGAAGGTAFGLSVGWGATISSGAERIAEMTGLGEAIAEADIVITGEGRYDFQSLLGKSVGHTLRLVDESRSFAPESRHRPQAWVIAGDIASDIASTVATPGAIAHTLSLSVIAGSTAAASANPLHWLREAGIRAAHSTGKILTH
jgi:glycerate kinase